MQTTRNERRKIKKDNTKKTKILTEVPREEWPQGYPINLVTVWRSRFFLVQGFAEPSGMRLSVNRPVMDPGGRWKDDITWDELQEIKRQAGFGDKMAIEIYPDDLDIVNVANMRHLWVLDESLPIGWKNEDSKL